MEILYRKATETDLPAITAFVDYWLTGGGKADGIPGATHDYFVRAGQQKAYLVKYDVMLATCAGEIVGWAVKTKKGVLIHLLIAATFRGRGIGGEMLRKMDPEVVRSKFDQKSGDPAEFYRKQGYVKASPVRVGKKLNIELFRRIGDSEAGCDESLAEASEPAKRKAKDVCVVGKIHQRTIDAMAEKLELSDFLRRRFSD
ncbi:hypothetical protein ES708_04783 [subsurface metagenome]